MSKKIFIDAGHGGKDPGAVYEKLKEKEINFFVAKRVDLLFSEAGYDVLLSRYRDESLSLEKRVELANEFKADVFCSIHCNASSDSKANGCETYYTSPKGEKIAQEIQNNLAKYSQFFSRGIKPKGFYVLKYTKMPAVLVEVGFISNESDRDKLIFSSIQNVLSYCIYWGILEGMGEEVKWKEQFLKYIIKEKNELTFNLPSYRKAHGN